MRLSDIFMSLAHRWGNRPAVISPERSLSYRELVTRAARSARELNANGIVPGARVGVALRDGSEALVLMLAVWLLDATVVPIDFRSNPGERGKLAGEFDLAAIVEDRKAPTASYPSVL